MNIFKMVAQGFVDASLPVIKLELLALLTVHINGARSPFIPDSVKPYVLDIIGQALDGWRIKI